MTGPQRRTFEAEMTLQYCRGTPLLATTLFGWGCQTVTLGLAERRTVLMCLALKRLSVDANAGKSSYAIRPTTPSATMGFSAHITVPTAVC